MSEQTPVTDPFVGGDFHKSHVEKCLVSEFTHRRASVQRAEERNRDNGRRGQPRNLYEIRVTGDFYVGSKEVIYRQFLQCTFLTRLSKNDHPRVPILLYQAQKSQYSFGNSDLEGPYEGCRLVCFPRCRLQRSSFCLYSGTTLYYRTFSFFFYLLHFLLPSQYIRHMSRTFVNTPELFLR